MTRSSYYAVCCSVLPEAKLEWRGRRACSILWKVLWSSEPRQSCRTSAFPRTSAWTLVTTAWTQRHSGAREPQCDTTYINGKLFRLRSA
jgi:hypothetical protein